MQYQKITNLIDDTPNQPSKFTTKNWFEINDDARGTYSKDGQFRFKTSMLKSSIYTCEWNYNNYKTSR